MVSFAYGALSFICFLLFYALVLKRAGESMFEVAHDARDKAGQSLASRFSDRDGKSGRGRGGRHEYAPLTRERAFHLMFTERMLVLVRRWVERMGAQGEDVKDVAQQVFLAAFESFPGYDPSRSRPERWLNRIALNKVRHFQDKAYHEREQLDPSPGEDRVDERPGVEEQFDEEQRRLLMLELLQKVDIELRVVLVAHDIDGIPMSEIAELYGMPLSTAYKWRARARAALEAVAVARGLREKRRG